jgi:hypothetical protein
MRIEWSLQLNINGLLWLFFRDIFPDLTLVTCFYRTDAPLYWWMCLHHCDDHFALQIQGWVRRYIYKERNGPWLIHGLVSVILRPLEIHHVFHKNHSPPSLLCWPEMTPLGNTSMTRFFSTLYRTQI